MERFIFVCTYLYFLSFFQFWKTNSTSVYGPSEAIIANIHCGKCISVECMNAENTHSQREGIHTCLVVYLSIGHKDIQDKELMIYMITYTHSYIRLHTFTLAHATAPPSFPLPRSPPLSSLPRSPPPIPCRPAATSPSSGARRLLALSTEATMAHQAAKEARRC